MAFQGCTQTERADKQPFKTITPADFSHVKITDGFWAPRLHNHATTTLAVCIDQIENQTGRIRNFENAAKGEHSGSWTIQTFTRHSKASSIRLPTIPELERKADEVLDIQPCLSKN
jgi:hypothetical protein